MLLDQATERPLSHRYRTAVRFHVDNLRCGITLKSGLKRALLSRSRKVLSDNLLACSFRLLADAQRSLGCFVVLELRIKNFHLINYN